MKNNVSLDFFTLRLYLCLCISFVEFRPKTFAVPKSLISHLCIYSVLYVFSVSHAILLRYKVLKLDPRTSKRLMFYIFFSKKPAVFPHKFHNKRASDGQKQRCWYQATDAETI